MSWGERSCARFGNCPMIPKPRTCNVDCKSYVHDGSTKPDSVSQKKKNKVGSL